MGTICDQGKVANSLQYASSHGQAENTLLSKKAIDEVSAGHPGFSPNTFAVPKTNGGTQMVLSLRPLNQ
ncbi:hypothetical protein AYI70_g5560 [Smittium culicis]|uniref:Uncharacterized protein n=1 Tax=Smittium culicis TaxID=133412 RepID=A0A1R1XTZ7_9FUNG|nr:hypothetical protein AYI70_g5560 [Smittium culicis]